VHTVDAAHPFAEAVATSDDRIVFVGDEAEAIAWAGPTTEVVDAGDATVLPGFVDAHNHVRLGSNPNAVQLGGATTLDEIRDRIAVFTNEHPDATWVEGEGCSYGAIPGGRPTAEMLVGAAGGRPIFLTSYDSHTAWLDHGAMSLLGVDPEHEHLAWGTAELDATSGNPTGWIHDFAVLGISEAGEHALAASLPSYAPDAAYARLSASLAMAARLGVTTVVEPQNGPGTVPMFTRARDSGDLLSRLIVAILCQPDTGPEQLDALRDLASEPWDDRLRVGPLKLYIDDVIEPHTAAMLEPYANRSDTRGDTLWDPDAFSAFMVEAERRGLQTFTHATGDRGIRTVLDAVEHCRAMLGPRDARHQVVHAECVHPDDIPRFGQLGVVACMQPRHCAPDIVGPWRANVGADRERFGWPFRSIQASGGVLAFSSDWNVAEMDPMTWLYTAVTRADLDGRDAWNTDETIDLPTAVRAATLGSAWANFAELDRGTISSGKYADLVILSRDLFAPGDPRVILDTQVRMTIVGGRIVHQARD
jgi:predicted amidohydrolase YtcJ